MNLPLNEWAVAIRPGNITGNEPWNGFVELTKILVDQYDVQKILFTKSDAADFRKEVFALQSKTERERLLTFFDKYIGKYTEPCPVEEYICQEEGKKDNGAVLLTMAYNENLPIVSILYDNTFACDAVKACLYNRRKEKVTVVNLKNLYAGNLERYNDFFFTGIPPRKVKPQSEPIWNLERTKMYCDTLPSLAGLSKNEKTSRFVQEGTHVAQLNGWVKDKKLSEINSTPQKMRHVFRPEKFRDNEAAYLSIDLEKRAFELLDHRGRHLREISYLGEKNTGYKPNHDIRLN